MSEPTPAAGAGAAPPVPQRAWQAPCPSCGAPVAFLSAASLQAVCDYCQSSVVRTDGVLERVGRVSERFEDHSPLQRWATGRWPRAWSATTPPWQPHAPPQGDFTLIGRLQWRGREGVWSEWLALAGDATSVAWLAEDNGRHIAAVALEEAHQVALRAQWAALAGVPSGPQGDQKATDAAFPPRSPSGGAHAGLSLEPLTPPTPGKTAAPSDGPAPPDVPNRLRIGVVSYRFAALQPVLAVTAEGEWQAPGEAARLPTGGWVGEWRSDTGQVLSVWLDGGGLPGAFHVGVDVALPDLALQGLREHIAQDGLRGAAMACPNCGGALAPLLGQSRCISCPQCTALIDLGVGRAQGGAGAVGTSGGQPVPGGAAQGAATPDEGLAHAWQLSAVLQQDRPLFVPALTLGSSGRLKGSLEQIVGYQIRRGDGGGETFFWCEYLLYNAHHGFRFLVESSEGWMLYRTLTGSPTPAADSVVYAGTRYRAEAPYTSRVVYVAGEFYWPVVLDERATHAEFVAVGGRHPQRLSREQTQRDGAMEIIWSHGVELTVAEVQAAFLKAADSIDLARLQTGSGRREKRFIQTVVVILIFFFLAMALLVLLQDDCDPQVESCSSRSGSLIWLPGNWGGTSYGGGSGWGSGGGSHK